MAIQIFVNLPVKNLARSVEFFTRTGFTFNPEFTDKNATCMIVSDDIFVMLLVEDFFKTFTTNPICDATKSTEVLICLSLESRAIVDEMVDKALAAGGKTPKKPLDLDAMYQRSFQDLDGHLWEIMHMTPTAVQIGPEDV
jgi:hypothetical protein